MSDTIVPSDDNLICITSQSHEWDDIFRDINDPGAHEVSRDNEDFKAKLEFDRKRNRTKPKGDKGKAREGVVPDPNWTEREKSVRLAELLNKKTVEKRWPPKGMALGDLWGKGEFSVSLDMEGVSMLRTDYRTGTEVDGVASQNPVISIRINDQNRYLEGAKVGVSPAYAESFDDPGKFLSSPATIVNGSGNVLFTYSYDTNTLPVFVPVG
jgi:hypothetical protein